MRAMKDSGIEWIGVIPNHWAVSRLKFCAKIDSGEMISKDEFDEHGQVPVIGSNGEIGRANKCNNQMPVITTGRVGTVGTVQIVADAWITDNALIIDPKININYLKHVIPNFDFDAMLSGTAQPLITATKLGNQHIPLPSENEQECIANYLDQKCADIDALIVAKEKSNALLKERRQSIIYEAVTKGLNPDTPMKDSGIEWIGRIPAGWDVIRIKHLRNNEENSFEDGDWIEAPYISETGIRYLTTGNIGDGAYKEQGNGFITQETFSALRCKYAYPGDLVFSRLNAPYGRACILPNYYSEYVLAVDNVILRTDHCKKFLCYVTQCLGYQRMVEEKANGTTMKRVSRTNLGDISLPIPTLAEQAAIANYLDTECVTADAVISANEATIQKLKEYRQSIIYEAVTGKIEI